MLGSPELSWLIDRIRSRLERGEPIDGTMTLVGATPAQRKAAARLLGRGVGRGTTLSVPLPVVAAELWRAAAAPNLVAAIEALSGPVRNLAAERAADLQRWGDALSGARSSWLSHLAWYRAWLDSISRDGSVTRLIRQGHSEAIGQATAVLERLPSDTDEGTALISALAETATGDPQALAEGSAAATLVLRALALREGVQPPAGRDAEQALWAAAGVVSDDLASQVLVLNLRAGGEPLGRWLREAADAGQPFRLTLRQLTAAPVVPLAADIFVCSSSALMRAAADQLGTTCPALVCTEGAPSVACTQLLHAAVASGSSVRWHADFSWAGLRSTAAAVRRLAAQPWLMAAADYQGALPGGGQPLTGQPEQSPWDPKLTELMRVTGRAVPEERLLPQLLTELTELTGLIEPAGSGQL